MPRSTTHTKHSVSNHTWMCACGRSGRFHACLLATEEAPELCSRCGGLGRYVAQPELPVWRRDYYADCDCPLERRIDGLRTRRQRIDALNAISQAPAREMRFENFDPYWPARAHERKSLQTALNLAREYAASPQAWSLTFLGPYGCGKTHLGRAMQAWRNDPANRMAGAAFVVVPDLLDYIRATFNRDAVESYDQRFDRVRNASFLILDDLGAEKGTDWADEKLFQIINHRYSHEYPTVVLTNVPLTALEGRIESRLSEGIVHVITAGDYRRRKQ